jgi:hypothetical protein
METQTEPRQEEITLKKYVQVLRAVANNEIKYFQKELSKTEKRMLIELQNAGLITDSKNDTSRVLAMITRQPFMLTPAGASALAQWSEFIWSQGVWSKLLSWSSQLAWLVVGLLLPSVIELIKRFL